MPAPACLAASGSSTTKPRAAGCCLRPSACSRLTRSPPRSSGAAPARRVSRRSWMTSRTPSGRRANASRPMSPRCCKGSQTRSCWNYDAMTTDGRPNGHAGGNGQPPKPLHSPLGLLAELTHRCPLGCPYCSNPLEMDKRERELDAAAWARVFREAAALGVLQVHLSGGEPASRRDLVDIMAAACDAGLYTNLITSGVGVTEERLRELVDAGLDHVQISIQDSEPKSADLIAGYAGAYARKRALAAAVAALKLPLTVNIVIHRANITRIDELVAMALDMGASRVEIAHVPYYGWALKNRAALMRTRQQVEDAVGRIEPLRKQHHGRIVIDAVVPDYYARFPKPCVGGWGRRSLNVTPAGRVLPCHAAESIPGLEFWSVREHSLADIWTSSPAFNAFRGTDWMQEPCRTCARRDIDFGGCRCQAFALTGDARAADPVCHLSPSHEQVIALAAMQHGAPYLYRTSAGAAA